MPLDAEGRPALLVGPLQGLDDAVGCGGRGVPAVVVRRHRLVVQRSDTTFGHQCCDRRAGDGVQRMSAGRHDDVALSEVRFEAATRRHRQNLQAAAQAKGREAQLARRVCQGELVAIPGRVDAQVRATGEDEAVQGSEVVGTCARRQHDRPAASRPHSVDDGTRAGHDVLLAEVLGDDERLAGDPDQRLHSVTSAVTPSRTPVR